MSTTAVIGGAIGAGIGFMIAGPVGAGWGFSIGFGLGSMLDGMESPEAVNNPPQQLQAQTSQQGLPLQVVFGQRRVAGNLIWYGNFQTYKHKQSTGGKGAPTPQGATSYTYSASFAFGVCAGPIADILSIWEDKDEIDMGREGSDFTIHLGSVDQSADTHMDTFLSRNSAYRGLAYVVFMDWDLGASARIPNFTFEVAGIGYNAESLTTETDIQEFGALSVPGLNAATDPLKFMGGYRIYCQDNGGDEAALFSYTTGVYSDTFEVVASFHVRSSFSHANSDTLGIYRRNGYGACEVSSNRSMLATAGGVVLYYYDALTDTMNDLAYARTMCGTRYNGGPGAGWDCAYNNGYYAACVPYASVAGTASGTAGPVTVWQLQAATDANVDPTNFKLVQITRSGSWQGGETRSCDFNSSGRLAVLGRYYTMKMYSITASQMTEEAALYNMNSLWGQVDNWMVKWHPDGDRVAISHTANNSRSVTILDENLNEKCHIQIQSGYAGSVALRDIEWSPDGKYLYGVQGLNIAQLYYDRTTDTLSQRALTTANNSYTSAQYLCTTSLSDRIIIYGTSFAWIGAFQIKTIKTGSGEVTPPYVTERILTNDFWGAGIDSSYLVNSVFQATKDYCLENDYLVSYNFKQSQSVLDALDDMIAHHDGYITCIDNQIEHRQLEVESSTVLIDNDYEIKGKELGISKDGARDNINRVRIAYVNRENKYETAVVQRDAIAEQDRYGIRDKNVSLLGFSLNARADKMAQRLLKKYLNPPLNMAIGIGPKARGKLLPGTVFDLQHSVCDITSIKCRVSAISEEPGDMMSVEFKEEMDFTYNTSLQAPPTAPTSPWVDEYELRAATSSCFLYLSERYIDKLGDPTRIIAGVVSQNSDIAFAGADLYQSPDGANFTSAKMIYDDAVVGTVTAVDTSPGYWNKMTVTLRQRECDNFVSYSSRDTFNLNRFNLAYYNDRKIKFQNITAQGSLEYLLENITVSEPLNMTTTAGSNEIIFITYGNWDYVNYDDLASQAHRQYKAPTFNFVGVEQDISTVDIKSMYIGMEAFKLKPVVNLGVIVNSMLTDQTRVTLPSCDTTIAWRHRSRLEGYGRKGFGIGLYGHSITDDIVGWQVYINSVSQGVHSLCQFTHPTNAGSEYTFGVRQVSNNYNPSSVEEITIKRI